MHKVVEIGNYLFSDQIFEKQFICDLKNCKGGCCIEGDAGAPLIKEELKEVEKAYPYVKDMLSQESLDEIKKTGLFEIDDEFEEVTPVIGNGLCVYAYQDDHGIYKCSFEKAYQEGKTDWLKPISCHLFPIRTKTLDAGFVISNYEYRSTCDSACTLGEQEKMPLFQFLRTAIERFYGADTYQEMEKIYENYFQNTQE